MTKYSLLITLPAENDLQGIANYIAKELREPGIAQRVITKIGEAILELEQMPFRNALVSDEKLAAKGIRKLILDNYIVFYVVSKTDKTVTILRILYGKRDWRHLL